MHSTPTPEPVSPKENAPATKGLRGRLWQCVKDDCSEIRHASALNRWETIVNVLLLPLTLLALIIAIFQGCETVRSNNIALESSRREQRAYVYPVTEDRPKLIFSSEADEFVFELQVKNGGQTPAFDSVARIATVYRLRDEDIGPSLELAVILKTKMTVGPGQSWTLHTARKLTDDDLRLELRGKCAIWVVGSIQYRDAFGDERQTIFRFKQKGSPLGDGKTETLDMEVIEIASD